MRNIYSILIIIIIFYILSIEGQWQILTTNPSTDINGNLYHLVPISFKPRIIAKHFQTNIQYTDAIKCANNAGLCTGILYLDPPYYKYKIAIQKIIPHGVRQLKVTSYETGSLQVPTSTDPSIPESNTPTSVTPTQFTLNNVDVPTKNFQLMNKRLNTPKTDSDYLSLGYKTFYLMNKVNSDTSRKLLQSTPPPINTGSFSSQCGLSFAGSFCQDQIDASTQTKGNNTENQAKLAGLTRLKAELTLEVKALTLAGNFTQQLASAITELISLGNTDVIPKAQNVLNSLGANIAAQNADAKSLNVTAASQASAVAGFTAAMAGLGFTLAQQQANLINVNLGFADERTLLERGLNYIQEQQALYNVRTTSQIQQAQLISSIAQDLQNNIQQIVNDPYTQRTLTTLMFQAIDEALSLGLVIFADYPGVRPVQYTNDNKYEDFMSGAYWYILSTNIVLPNGNLQPSWVVERMFYTISCDVTYFALSAQDQANYFSVAQWFGPQGQCDVDPIGSCTCRMLVSYQRSRNPIVSNWVVNYTAHNNLIDPPTSKPPLLPSTIQNLTSLYNGQPPTSMLYNLTNLPSDFDNVTYYMQPYRQRWLYTLADVQSELEVKCLQSVLASDQIPLTSSPTFITDPLRSTSGDPSLYFVRATIVAQTDNLIPLSSPIPVFNASQSVNTTLLDFDLTFRPYCQPTLDVVAQFNAIQPTFGSVLYNGQMLAYRAYIPRLASIATYITGVLPTPLDIVSQDFAYQTVDGVNDTLTRSDQAIMVATSVSGVTGLKLYDRQTVINVTFVPDSRSTDLQVQNLNSITAWNSDVGNSLPDYIKWIGYPNCLFQACPIDITAMNGSLITNTSGVYSAYLYTPPDKLNPTSIDSTRRYNAINYIQRDYRFTDPVAIKNIFTSYNGFNTSLRAPTLHDVQQSSRGILKPSLAKISLANFIQPLQVDLYTVPINSDGGSIESFLLSFCDQSIRISTDETECDRLDKAYPYYNADTSEMWFYPYDYTITDIPLRIPTNTQISFPAPTSFCPDSIQIDRTILQKPVLQIYNTIAKSNSAFQVLATPCLSSGSDALHIFVPNLNPWQVQHVVIPGCNGQIIQVISNSTDITISTPIVCFSYSPQPEFVSPQTVQQGIISRAQISRDPVITLSNTIGSLTVYGQTLTATTIADTVVNALYGSRNTSILAQQTQNIANAGTALDTVWSQLQNYIFTLEQQDGNLQSEIALIEQQVRNIFLENEAEALLQSLIMSLIAQFGQTLATEAQLNIAVQDYANNLNKIGPTLNPYNYFFASADSGFNWTDVTMSSFVSNMEQRQCLALYTTPSYSQTITPCSVVAYNPNTWFNCIQGQNYGFRSLVQLLILFGISVIIWRLAAKKSFQQFFTNKRPHNYINPHDHSL